MNSILDTIKKMLGIGEDDTNFDQDIIVNINSVLMSVNQLGIGSESGVFIIDNTKTWTDLLGDRTDLEAIKSYVYLKVRLLFDPPSSSFVIESMERQITQFEWRLNVQMDNSLPVEEDEDDEECCECCGC